MLPDPSFHWYGALLIVFTSVCWTHFAIGTVRLLAQVWDNERLWSDIREATVCSIGIHLDWLYCGAWFRNCKHCELLQQRKDSQWVTVPSRGTNDDEHYV